MNKEVIEIQQAATGRIVVEIREQFTGCPTRTSKKAFEGRWIVGTPDNPELHVFKPIGGYIGGERYAVAVTKQNRIVVLSPNVDESEEARDCFAIYDDLDDFSSANIENQYPRFPESLIAAVKYELGVDHTEEMDI
jgi:hypothetical protein